MHATYKVSAAHTHTHTHASWARRALTCTGSPPTTPSRRQPAAHSSSSPHSGCPRRRAWPCGVSTATGLASRRGKGGGVASLTWAPGKSWSLVRAWDHLFSGPPGGRAFHWMYSLPSWPWFASAIATVGDPAAG